MKKTVLLLMSLLTPSLWASNVNVNDLVVREMLPGSKSTAGYFTLTNHSNKTVTLQSVSATALSRVEVHEHTMNNGVMKMQQVKQGLTIEPHQQLVFQPGGYHLMLFNPQQKIKKGMTLDLTFNFKTEQAIKASAKVVSVLDQHKKATSHAHHH